MQEEFEPQLEPTETLKRLQRGHREEEWSLISNDQLLASFTWLMIFAELMCALF